MITHFIYRSGPGWSAGLWRALAAAAVMIALGGAARAEQFSANFKGTDIQEFINTVSKTWAKPSLSIRR